MLEGERLDTVFQLNVKGTIQLGSGLVVRGAISAESRWHSK